MSTTARRTSASRWVASAITADPRHAELLRELWREYNSWYDGEPIDRATRTDIAQALYAVGATPSGYGRSLIIVGARLKRPRVGYK